jgi:hypothetical protein
MSLKTAFAELRSKHKLIARQNFMCCNSCGCSAIGTVAKGKPRDRRPKGYVFFCKQDGQHLKNSGRVHVGFGQIPGTSVPSLAFGKLAAEVFVKHGCPVEWNGKSDTRLLVWRDENTRREHTAKLLGKAA